MRWWKAIEITKRGEKEKYTKLAFSISFIKYRKRKETKQTISSFSIKSMATTSMLDCRKKKKRKLN
jgi:hypothetical protein